MDTTHLLHPANQHLAPSSKPRRKGWRAGVKAAAYSCLAASALNLIFTIIVTSVVGTEYGFGTLYDGDCSRVAAYSVGSHLCINIISSIFLAASNYTMQCLTAPTRQEVNQAHARGYYLDIGVHSVRNLTDYYGPSNLRRFLWLFLFCSSLPIHLLYNSAVFKTMQANDYQVLVANENLLPNGPTPADTTFLGDYGEYSIDSLISIFTDNDAYQNPARVQNLSNADCISAYGAPFVSKYGDVIAVTSYGMSDHDNRTLFYHTSLNGFAAPGTDHSQSDGTGIPGWDWICNSQGRSDCNQTFVTENDSSQWAVVATSQYEGLDPGQRYPIKYCLAARMDEHCKLEFSLQILIPVIIIGAMKAGIMFLILYILQDVEVLVTFGDGVASFLDDRDQYTAGLPHLVEKAVVKRVQNARANRSNQTNKESVDLTVAPEKPTFTFFSRSGLRSRRPWGVVPPKPLWCTTILSSAVLLSWATALVAGLARAFSETYVRQQSGGNVFQLVGFATIDPRTLAINADKPLLDNVVTSNIPQIAASFCYLLANNVATNMLAAYEYSSYGLRKKKALRVTRPLGAQRSTYFLQLPYRYSVPILLSSIILHWLISQSFFAVQIEFDTSEVSSWSTQTRPTATGSSPLAIVVTVVYGFCMLLALIGLGFRRMKSGMPIAASCSLSLAAACHRPDEDVDAAYKEVHYGVPIVNGRAGGHACFTSFEVVEDIESPCEERSSVDKGMGETSVELRELLPQDSSSKEVYVYR